MQQLTQSTPLEQSILGLHTNNKETKEWFYGSVVSILQNDNFPYFKKADKLASAFLNIDRRVIYIKDQIRLLQQIKKQLETSRNNAKEQVAKALTSFGVEKLEGVQVSSISITPASDKSVTHINVLNEDALIKAGYFTVVLDTQAVEEALYSADQRYEVEAFVNMSVETIHKPSTIRINKRKAVTSDPVNIEAA